MYLALTAALGVMGLGAIVVCGWSLAQVLRLVPAGQRPRAARLMARWQFGAVAHLGGEATIRHANLFLRASMLLLGVVVCGVIIGGVKLIDAQNGPPEQTSQLGASTESPGSSAWDA